MNMNVSVCVCVCLCACACVYLPPFCFRFLEAAGEAGAAAGAAAGAGVAAVAAGTLGLPESAGLIRMGSACNKQTYFYIFCVYVYICRYICVFQNTKSTTFLLASGSGLGGRLWGRG